jgi:ABC-type multidrug transport system permease subunit
MPTLLSCEGLFAALLFGGPALLFLVFLCGFALFPGLLFGILLLLLGGFPGFAAIFSDAAVFSLSVRRDRACSGQGGKQYEGRESFHEVSDGKSLQRS